MNTILEIIDASLFLFLVFVFSPKLRKSLHYIDFIHFSFKFYEIYIQFLPFSRLTKHILQSCKFPTYRITAQVLAQFNLQYGSYSNNFCICSGNFYTME